MSYEKFLAQGLRIGSGEVESAHRYIPQKRLKISGATWHPYRFTIQAPQIKIEEEELIAMIWPEFSS